MVTNIHFLNDHSPSLDPIVHHIHTFKFNVSVILLSVSMLRVVCAVIIVVI
jgi:hypothetical protein